jgi:hypothetical protein
MIHLDNALEVPVVAMASETASKAITLPSTTGIDWEYRILFLKSVKNYPGALWTLVDFDWDADDGTGLEVVKTHTLSSKTSLVGLKGSRAAGIVQSYIQAYNKQKKRWYQRRPPADLNW